MSEFSCPVVQIEWLKPVPNSDALDFTQVYETNVIVRKGQLKTGDLAVYIPLESMVPMAKPQFQGLGIKSERELYRVKAVRLRGTYSEGLLVPLPDTRLRPADQIGDKAMMIGQDMASEWGITKYEEPETPTAIQGTKGAQQDKDITWAPRYNVEPLVKNRHAIPEGMDVVVTEKLHGCNGRYVYGPDVHGTTRLIVGSHNVWKRPFYSGNAFIRKLKTFANKLGFQFKLEEPINDDVWWTIAKRLDLAAKLAKYPKLVVYGEVYGAVQDLKYSVPADEKVAFRVFDMYDANTKSWLRHQEVVSLCAVLGLEHVPVLYKGPYNPEVDKLRSGKSTVDGVTLREGFVIRPLNPVDPKDKAAYKYVSEEYKLRKGVTTEFH